MSGNDVGTARRSGWVEEQEDADQKPGVESRTYGGKSFVDFERQERTPNVSTAWKSRARILLRRYVLALIPDACVAVMNL